MMELTFINLVLTSLFIYLLLELARQHFISKSKRNPSSKTIPGPWKLPIIGSMHHLAGGSLPHHVLRDLARKCGPIMHLQLGEISNVIVSSPDAAKDVLKTHDLAFASRPEILASKILGYNNTDIAFSPYGDYWKQMRKICLLELLSPKTVRSFGTIREDEARKLVASIKSPGKVPINITEKVFSFTNAVVCRTAFGKGCRDPDRLISLINEAILAGGSFEIADFFPSLKFLHFMSGLKKKLLKLHEEIDGVLEDIVAEHERMKMKSEGMPTENATETGGVGDLIDVLLRIKERGDLQIPISTNSIKAVIWDVFAAGTETSAATVDWAMAEMMRHPRVMQKAQAEMREALKVKGKDSIQESDIKGLDYLKSVIKETLRLHPPLPLLLPRESREPSNIGGYDIPPKTRVMINAWAINRDPVVWKDAETFKPERFVDSDGGIECVGTNFEYIPFGGGRRICPGISFGMASVELLLARLLYHFDWALPSASATTTAVPPDMTETFGATARRKHGLYLVATFRPPPPAIA